MWITQWKFRGRFDLHWWVFGLHFTSWDVTLCLGPIGLSIVRSDIHI